MSDISDIKLLPLGNRVQAAKNRFLNENLHVELDTLPSFEDEPFDDIGLLNKIADDFGLDRKRLMRAADSENWWNLRNRNRAKLEGYIADAQDKALAKVAEGIVERQTRHLLELDTFVTSNLTNISAELASRLHVMADKDAIAYMKLVLGAQSDILKLAQRKIELDKQKDPETDERKGLDVAIAAMLNRLVNLSLSGNLDGEALPPTDSAEDPELKELFAKLEERVDGA